MIPRFGAPYARSFARATALALTALSVGCGKKEVAAPPPVPVTVARVERKNVPFELPANGTVEPLQAVAVESQVTGYLTRVAFKEGDDVKANQVLFQIDPRPFAAALAQARGMLERDLAQLKNAEIDVQRYEQLVAKDYVTTQQYDQAKTTAATLRATVTADSGAVEAAQLNLQFATIRAPISGRAGGLLVKEGNLVKASGSTLVTINQIKPILVRFAVPASSLPAIRKYGSAALPVSAKPATATGAPSQVTLSFVDNAVDTTTGTILLKGRFDNKDAALWPGEFVNVVLELFTQENVLVIPTQAVVQGQQGTYVFIVNSDATASQRPITTLRSAGDLTVVDKGLNAGETVVTDGQLRLTAGSKVQVKAAPGGDQQRTG